MQAEPVLTNTPSNRNLLESDSKTYEVRGETYGLNNGIVLYHYTFSPYAKRVVWYLTLRGIDYAECVRLTFPPTSFPPSLEFAYKECRNNRTCCPVLTSLSWMCTIAESRLWQLVVTSIAILESSFASSNSSSREVPSPQRRPKPLRSRNCLRYGLSKVGSSLAHLN